MDSDTDKTLTGVALVQYPIHKSEPSNHVSLCFRKVGESLQKQRLAFLGENTHFVEKWCRWSETSPCYLFAYAIVSNLKRGAKNGLFFVLQW